MVHVTQCREENQGRRDWLHLFLLWSFFAVVSPVQSQPQTAVCSGGVFKQVWTLESLLNILPSPMHTSGAVVSCLFIWRWVRSLLCFHFSPACSVTHALSDFLCMSQLSLSHYGNVPFLPCPWGCLHLLKSPLLPVCLCRFCLFLILACLTIWLGFIIWFFPFL